MKLFLTLSFLFSFHSAFTQLKCKTLKGVKGDSVICFHQNGKISSITSASPLYERYWSFSAFDQKGSQVYSTDYGLRHGSGSVDILYHSNGAIKSARKTFQPDGGIQYYDVTTFFKEDGSFDHEEDNSWDRHERLLEPVVPVKKEEKKEIVNSEKLDTLYFWIKNASGRTQRVLIGSKDKDSPKELLRIKKGEEKQIKVYIPKNNKKDPLLYFDLDVIPGKKKEVFPVYIGLEHKQNQYVYLIERP